MEHVPDLTPHLAYLFPVVMARGVSAGSLYDPELQLFVHDSDDHEAYKRCVTRSCTVSSSRVEQVQVDDSCSVGWIMTRICPLGAAYSGKAYYYGGCIEDT